MKTLTTLSAIKKWNIIERASMLLVFVALLSFSKNSSACDASFVDSVYGNTVYFINTSQGGYPTYFWYFGDNTTSSDQNPVHTYTDTGHYYVCLVIVDFFNNCSDTACQYVMVSGNNGGGCSASFIYSDSLSTAYFFNTSVASNSAYWFWSFGDGTASDLENPTHEYNGFGPYDVCLTVYDTANNCSDTYCENIYLNNNGGGCQAYFTYSVNALGVNFTNLSAGNYTSVVWDFGDNDTSYFNNPFHTYATSGTYYVCVTVSDTGNNCNDTYCQYVYVNDTAQCHSIFAYTENGNDVQFVNYSTSQCNNITWYWWFGDGAYSSNYDPSHLYASSGVYTVCLSMYDSYCGCSDSECMQISVGNNNILCSASFVLYPDSSQQGLYWGYNYSTGNNLVYTWTWGDGTSSTGAFPSHVYSDSGYYTICLTILDTVSQCTDSYCSNYYIMKQAKLDQIHEVIFVNATGVAPVSGNAKVNWNIYPNPASDNMRITTSSGKVDEIRITDVNGKVVKKIFNYNGNAIELKSLQQEVYIVQSLINGNWSSKLLIKQ